MGKWEMHKQRFIEGEDDPAPIIRKKDYKRQDRHYSTVFCKLNGKMLNKRVVFEKILKGLRFVKIERKSLERYTAVPPEA